MPDTDILVYCSDECLAKAVLDIVTSAKKCRFVRLGEVDCLVDRLDHGNVALVVAHLPDAGQKYLLDRLLHLIFQSGNRLPVIVLTECNDPSLRLSLLQQGAMECLLVPFDLERLALLIDILTVRIRHNSRKIVDNTPHTEKGVSWLDHYAVPPGMELMVRQLRAVASTQTTVLLTGETGVGKSHMARLIHDMSPRREKPFVVVECGSLTPSLLASELYGHVRGSFTDASRDHTGKLTEAQDGTILLDEIDSIPLDAQGKLLRVMEERVFEPVGSNRPQPVRARMIVATNRRLEDEVAEGRFRQDLYYRLNVVEFPLHPLRGQKELIQPLVQRFLSDFSAREQRPKQSFSAPALAAMEAYDWPGNVRELRNAVERAVALCSTKTINLEDLPATVRSCLQTEEQEKSPPPSRNGLDLVRSEAELSYLTEALQRNHGCRAAAAAELGISRVTLYKKLHRYGLT